MPFSKHGWELHIERIVAQGWQSKKRTYGSYNVYLDGVLQAGLSGFICECPGPGDNNAVASDQRIAVGRYRPSTQYGKYRSVGYSDDSKPAGTVPMPGLLLLDTQPRTAILIHPAHPPDLYLSSEGCLNPTKGLMAADSMDFWDSRSRVIALIDSLQDFASSAFDHPTNTVIPNAFVVIDGEPAAVAV